MSRRSRKNDTIFNIEILIIRILWFFSWFWLAIRVSAAFASATRFNPWDSGGDPGWNGSELGSELTNLMVAFSYRRLAVDGSPSEAPFHTSGTYQNCLEHIFFVRLLCAIDSFSTIFWPFPSLYRVASCVSSRFPLPTSSPVIAPLTFSPAFH